MADQTTAIVNAVLKILRGQRDDKQWQHLSGTYALNPQVFGTGNHYIVGPIVFTSPFTQPPRIAFGQIAQQDPTQVTTVLNKATGYTPLCVHAYVYSFVQASKQITSFYMGLYALTPVPQNNNQYTISWIAEGKGTPYSGQRTDEAWTTAYNQNSAPYLTTTTGAPDVQS